MPAEPTGSVAAPGRPARGATDAGVEPPLHPRRRSWLHRLLEPLEDYARVTAEAVMTVAAGVVGFVILPSLAPVTPPAGALRYVELTGPNLPTYVGVMASASDPRVIVVLGMDVPRGADARWTMSIAYDRRDHLTDLRTIGTVHVGSPQRGAGTLEFLQVTGTMAPGDRSYDKLRNGYVAYEGSTSRAGTQWPPGAEVVTFDVTGPVAMTARSGANLATTLLGISQTSTPPAGETAAPFLPEVVYTAGATYQDQTGGPTIEPGNQWEWTVHGEQVLPPAVATGVDNAQQTHAQNRFFAAAVLFGIAASSGAGFAIDLIVVVQRRRRLAEAREHAARAARTAGP